MKNYTAKTAVLRRERETMQKAKSTLTPTDSDMTFFRSEEHKDLGSVTGIIPDINEAKTVDIDKDKDHADILREFIDTMDERTKRSIAAEVNFQKNRREFTVKNLHRTHVVVGVAGDGSLMIRPRRK